MKAKDIAQSVVAMYETDNNLMESANHYANIVILDARDKIRSTTKRDASVISQLREARLLWVAVVNELTKRLTLPAAEEELYKKLFDVNLAYHSETLYATVFGNLPHASDVIQIAGDLKRSEQESRQTAHAYASNEV